jgi:hypothetical protein
MRMEAVNIFTAYLTGIRKCRLNLIRMRTYPRHPGMGDKSAGIGWRAISDITNVRFTFVLYRALYKDAGSEKADYAMNAAL